MTDDTGGGDARPRVSLVGYGSLLSPDELVPFLDDDGGDVVPVRVDGLRRVFNQRSVWRASVRDEGEAVLNAVRDPSASMNAVFVPDLNRREYDALRRRESGYRMIEVDAEAVQTYHDTDDVPETDLVLFPTGRDGMVEEGLDPIPEYVEVCLEGAEHWGDDFREEFLDTTEVHGGTLREYL